MDAGMARMMQDMHSPGYTGQPDSDFLATMIPHHEGAVDMARLVLIHGRDHNVHVSRTFESSEFWNKPSAERLNNCEVFL